MDLAGRHFDLASENIQDKRSGHSCKSTLQDFEILIVAVVTQFVLGYMRPWSIVLQAVAWDLVEGHIKARLLVDAMGYIRKNCNEYLYRLFKMISSIATENEITVTKLRSPGRQRHTANAATNTIEEHIRISLFNPFIDHVISPLNTRFPEEIKPMLFSFYLMIRYLDKLNDDLH